MNERKYVVIASYALSGGLMVNLLGLADCWSQAFRLIDRCDYKKVVYEEVAGDWSEDGIPIKEFGTESNGKCLIRKRIISNAKTIRRQLRPR